MSLLGFRQIRIAFLVLALVAGLIPAIAIADTGATDYYLLPGNPPCRQYDSREPSPGSPLTAGDSRTVTITGGPCGVPSDAVAVALNLTVEKTTATGNLSLYPVGATVAVASPAVASLSFNTGVHRAVNLIVELGASGDLVAKNNSTGTLHFIIDVSGYYVENEAPTDIALDNTTVTEGQPAGTVVGNLSTTDPDSGDTHTYSLVTGTGDTDNASFQISGNQLQTAAVLDFDTQPSYSVRIRSTDSGGLFIEEVFTITATGDNEAPTDIALSSSTVAENQPSGTAVGTFSTTDSDAGDTHTYSLATGTGDTDNASFTIVGNQLQTAAAFDFETKSSYSIRVRSTDAGGLFFEKVFTITVTNVNETPTDIALSNSTANEGQPAGTTVGTLSTTDPDAGDTFTYTLVAGTGSTDNGSFAIVGNQLQTAAVFDLETQSSYSIRVRSTDAGGLFFEKVFTITVTNVNEAPTDIALSPASVNENQPSGTTVGTFSTTDPDTGDTFTYTLVAGAGDTDNGSFTITGNQLQTAAMFDFETKSSYSIRVRSTDAGGLFFEKAFTITVTNVNETPTDIALSNATLAENQPSGTAVGTFSTTDPDAGDTFTYTLAAGAGSTDNGSFAIVGNQLQTAAILDFETKSSYSIRVRSTDAGGQFFEKVFTITVTNVNEQPTDIALTPTSVNEGQSSGTAVGTFSTTDPDVGDTFTYTLVAGAGSTDNGSFTIVGNQLQTAAVFDFETKPSYSIRVRSTDGGGLFFEKVFTITVNNVNEAPTDIALSPSSVNENQPAGTAVGTFSTTDPDTGDTFTYTLVAGAGSTDNGSFTIVGNQLQTAAMFDFETKSSYSIRVRSTDAGGLFFEKVFTITINNVNETPTDIALSPSSVNENQPAGTAVGTFSTTDPDAGDTFTYTLVAGTGSADNGAFTIVGNQLRTAAVFDFETKSSYSIRVRSTDSGGLFFEKAFTITVINVPEAPIAGNDAFDTVGNTLLEVDGTSSEPTPKVYFNGNVLSNDTDPDGPSTLTVTLNSSTPGAVVNLNSDGTFTYLPPAGATGTDSFTYNVSDGILTSVVPGTVTITLKHRVWYVKNDHAAGGLGRSTDPFDTLAEAETASAANDTIYVFQGDGTSADQNNGIALKNGQRLIGEGVALDVPVSVNGGPNPTPLRAIGTQPMIHNNTDDAGEDNGISVGATAASLTGIEIRGLNINGRDSGIDVTATGANNVGLTISNNTISSDGTTGLEGVDINANGTGTVTVTVSNNALSGRGNAFDARTAAASALRIDFSNNANILSNASGVVIDGSVGGGTTTITGFANNSVHSNTGGTGISVTSATFDQTPGGSFQPISGGTTVVGAPGVGNGVGAQGVVLTTVSGDLSFTDLDIFAEGGAGLRVSGTGAVNVGAGTGTRVTVGAGVGIFEATGGPAVDVNNATVDLQLSSLKSTTTSTGVSLVNVSDGSTAAVFSAGSGSSITASSGAGPAFNVSGGNAAITYGGTITNNGTGRAVSITTWSGDDATDDLLLSGAIDENGAGILLNGNGGSRAITFSGGMDIDTTSGEGFAATSNTHTLGLHITGTNTVSSTSATALRVTDTTIGSSDLNFQNVSSGNNTAAADPASGIILTNTGSLGGLKVTGTGASGQGGNGTGGLIQNTTSHGIALANTREPSFSNMSIQATLGSGISGTQVTDFTFDNGTINNSGDAVQESNIAFLDVAGTGNHLSGVVTITDNILNDAFDSGIDVRQGNATISDLTITGNSFTSDTTTVTSKGSAVLISLTGTATTVGNLTKALINGNTISRFPSGAGIKIIGFGALGGPDATLGVPGSGTNVITVTSNTIQGQVSPNQMGTNAIETGVFGEGQGNFNISNNGTAGTPLTNFKGVGVALSAFGAANVTGTISNNVIVANNINNSSGISSGVDQSFGINDTPSLTVTINNNNISGVQGNGILSGARNCKGTANVKIQNNIVAAPTAGVRPGIRVDAGTPAVGTDTTVCLNISGNTSAGSGGTQGIGLRKEGTNPAIDTFGINGMVATSSPGVETYVNGLNPAGGGTLLISATSGFSNCSLP